MPVQEVDQNKKKYTGMRLHNCCSRTIRVDFVINLTNRNGAVIHIYNGKSMTKVYYNRPGTIHNVPSTVVNRASINVMCVGIAMNRFEKGPTLG